MEIAQNMMYSIFRAIMPNCHERRLGRDYLKKFTFRLQTVLEIKEKALQDKQLEMAKILTVLNEQIQKKQALTTKKENIRNSLVQIYETSNALDIFEVMNYKNYLSLMINNIKTQEHVLENTRRLLYIKQKEVQEALKELKVLEKLKETQETKFYKHYDYVQAKEIDDLATTRYKRA